MTLLTIYNNFDRVAELDVYEKINTTRWDILYLYSYLFKSHGPYKILLTLLPINLLHVVFTSLRTTLKNRINKNLIAGFI